MKLSATLLLLSATSSAAFVAKPAFRSAAVETSSTSLFGSRQAQKKAARIAKAEKMGTNTAAPVAASNAGLMKGDEGLEFVRLAHPNGSSSDVYLYGGVVTSYKDAEGTEFIAVRPDAKMDGSKPISGGLSHCWPQFGPGEIQQHGFARNVMWEVKEMTDTMVQMQMTPSDYTKEMWDKDFVCTFTVTLEEDKLATEMLVENKGEEAFDMQAALHSYFTVSSLENLEIAGDFKGKEFLNKMKGDGGEMETEERDTITITEEYDRVYTGVKDTSLRDTGKGKELFVNGIKGWEDCVIWNPYGNEGMGYNEFVCVESVKFDPVSVGAGSSWLGEMTLEPKPLN